jgi:hypothetical protein
MCGLLTIGAENYETNTNEKRSAETLKDCQVIVVVVMVAVVVLRELQVTM